MSDRPNSKDRALAALTPPPLANTVLAGLTGVGGTGAETPFFTGSIFASRYRMIAPLDAGGLGEVWRADDLVLQTPVALKVLPATAAHARPKILDEVRLARQVTHPAVCRVYDVGEADGFIFYSMELVEGEDLGTLLRRAGRLPVEKVIDLGGQLCEALAAAHAQRVVHGNLKPANVLVDEDGLVRVTDFGITIDDAPSGRDRVYRAPELLAPGGHPSEQTDLYAAGVILYELLVGHVPGTGHDTGAARLIRPSKLVPEVGPRLDRVVLDALATNPRHRPASAAIMAERLRADTAPTAGRAPWRAIVAALSVVIALLVVTTFLLRRTPGQLSNRDTMVVADFTNATGEPVFDGALKVALAVALEQSPFLKVFPDERVRETLQLMERSPDERVTRSLARDIALRERLKAFVAGSIARLGTHYVLTLEAVNVPSGDVIAREQVEVPDREEVLVSLGAAAARLRGRLGESLASVEQFDAPLARATTASLEALHAYSLALDDGRMNMRVEAIPHLQRAIELDPQFALAQAMLSGIYANTGRTVEAPAYARRAFELRDRVSERERFFISWRYYVDSAQSWDQALELATSWAKTYPREPFAFNSLGMASAAFGRHEPAVNAFRTALRLDSRFVPPHGNLVGSLMALGRFDEARGVVRDARAQGIDAASLHRATYVLAFVDGDTHAMADALAAARTASGTALSSLNWEAHTAAFAGQIDLAHTIFQRAVQDAAAAGARETAAQWSTEDAESHALAGQCQAARPETSMALALSRDNFTLERAARVLAVCGAENEAAAITTELLSRFPEATLTRQIQVPVVNAISAVRTDPARAADRVDAARPYDSAPSAEFWPEYVRGLAYLGMKDGSKAGQEFRRILAHRGEAPTSLLYPLAMLGSARAAALAGDTTAARTAYEQFLQVWKDADRGLLPLAAARREYASLR